MLRIFKKKPSKKGFTPLGSKGVCKNCGAKGIWQVDPCTKELSGEEVLVCLCDKCYQWRKEDI